MSAISPTKQFKITGRREACDKEGRKKNVEFTDY